MSSILQKDDPFNDKKNNGYRTNSIIGSAGIDDSNISVNLAGISRNEGLASRVKQEEIESSYGLSNFRSPASSS